MLEANDNLKRYMNDNVYSFEEQPFVQRVFNGISFRIMNVIKSNSAMQLLRRVVRSFKK